MLTTDDAPDIESKLEMQMRTSTCLETHIAELPHFDALPSQLNLNLPGRLKWMHSHMVHTLYVSDCKSNINHSLIYLLETKVISTAVQPINQDDIRT
jgi:hypothetical protein